MEPLPPPDGHYLNAAQGWIGLGNSREAKAELFRISARHQEAPQVIETLWAILAAEKNWSEALAAAERLIAVSPGSPHGWIHQSYSLHELRRTQEAHDRLLGVAGRFLDAATIPYNLACYQCQLGNLAQARVWLDRAVKVQGKEDIKKMALTDPDLKPMWKEVRAL